MNNQRRGSRRHGQENSSITTNFRGTPSSDDDTRNDDSADQNSDSEQHADDVKKETKDNASTESEHPDSTGSGSNQYGHSPEEQAEYKKLQQQLATERKRREDASRKITEQGQTNSSLEEQVRELTGEVDTLKSQRAEYLMGGNRQSDLRSRYRENAFDDQGNGDQDLSPEDEMGLMRNSLSRLGESHKSLEERYTESENRQMYEDDLRYIENEFGVDKEAAVSMQDAFDQGDIVTFTKIYELSSLPKQARETLRTARQRRRSAAAVGHPGVQTSNYIPTDQGDDTAREKLARDIDKMTNTRARQRATQKALDEDPGMYPFFQALLKESGYTV